MSKSMVFWLLMSLSLLLAILPVRWTAWVRGLAQPIAWLQQPVERVAQGGREALHSEEPLSPQQQLALRNEFEELQRLVGQQQLTIDELENRLAEATALREQLGEHRGRIVIAAVVAFDTAPRRQFITISEGTSTVAGLREGLWIASGAPPEERTDSGRELLGRQFLVGRISEVHPFISRVQLITDPEFGPVRVEAARVLADGRWQGVETQFLLKGRGGAGMLIERAPMDLAALNARVILAPVSPELPAPLPLGWVEGARPVPEAALFFNIEVRALGSVRDRRYVYVIVPG